MRLHKKTLLAAVASEAASQSRTQKSLLARMFKLGEVSKVNLGEVSKNNKGEVSKDNLGEVSKVNLGEVYVDKGRLY